MNTKNKGILLAVFVGLVFIGVLLWKYLSDKSGAYINKVTWEDGRFTIHYYNWSSQSQITEDGTTDSLQCRSIINWLKIEGKIDIQQYTILNADLTALTQGTGDGAALNYCYWADQIIHIHYYDQVQAVILDNPVSINKQTVLSAIVGLYNNQSINQVQYWRLSSTLAALPLSPGG